MARNQPPRHLARHLPWLVIVLLGGLPGCGSYTAATNSVDVGAASRTEPAVGSERNEATAVTTSTAEISVPDPSPGEPVAAVMTIRPQRASVGETIEVLVHVRIASAHFIHASDEGGGPFVPVAVNLRLPEGVEPVGDWQLPTPEKGHGNSLVYRNSALLRRSFKVVSASLPETIAVTGELEYQVCTDELCWPQGKLVLSAPLTIQSLSR